MEDNAAGLADFLALMSFKVDVIVELLIKNGVINKEEFKELVFQKIDKGEDEEAKLKMKESLRAF